MLYLKVLNSVASKSHRLSNMEKFFLNLYTVLNLSIFCKKDDFNPWKLKVDVLNFHSYPLVSNLNGYYRCCRNLKFDYFLQYSSDAIIFSNGSTLMVNYKLLRKELIFYVSVFRYLKSFATSLSYLILIRTTSGAGSLFQSNR